MTARPSIIDDIDAISARIAELRAEASRMLNCTCRRSDDGTVIDASACPAHRAPCVGDELFAPLAA